MPGASLSQRPSSWSITVDQGRQRPDSASDLLGAQLAFAFVEEELPPAALALGRRPRLTRLCVQLTFLSNCVCYKLQIFVCFLLWTKHYNMVIKFLKSIPSDGAHKRFL